MMYCRTLSYDGPATAVVHRHAPAQLPNVDALRAFAVGLLPGSQVESLAAHVENCQNCQGRLADFDGAADELAQQDHIRPSEMRKTM